ncbi:MAG: aminopeptidase [Chloroflexi bacterium]|nr:aminopeptidase [Chloroflexota bacterium]
MEPLDFSQLLQRYAELTVKVALNVQPGQRLVIMAPLHTAPFIRQVARVAYQNGCPLVNVMWVDEELTLVRFQHASRNTFEEYPSWLTDGILQCLERGDAYLQVGGGDPDLLKGQDPELLAIAGRVAEKHNYPLRTHVSRSSVNWSIVCVPSPAWAMKVFPGETAEAAASRLWEAIFAACRLREADPIAVWQQHVTNLRQRCDYLNGKRYQALHFKAPGTDLTVGLPDGHIWAAGAGKSQTGVLFTANVPTEEVFTLPHREQVNGVVASTRPLSYRGSLIENFSLTFAAGRVVSLTAEKGEDILRQIIATDEDAARLGEVALVPHSSPISQSNLIYYNTLYDENAADHIALGRGLQFTMRGGPQMSEEQFTQAGGNISLIHMDFMVGSGQMDIDGITGSGEREPVMRRGEWSFQ